jgi:hypothetical protein
MEHDIEKSNEAEVNRFSVWEIIGSENKFP